jgi:hypothetical protein
MDSSSSVWIPRSFNKCFTNTLRVQGLKSGQDIEMFGETYRTIFYSICAPNHINSLAFQLILDTTSIQFQHARNQYRNTRRWTYIELVVGLHRKAREWDT